MTHRLRAAGLGLAAFLLLGSAARPGHAAGNTGPDTITSGNLSNGPGRTSVGSFQTVNGHNSTFAPANTFSVPVPPPTLTLSGLFDFESNTSGQYTTLTDTNGGISAKFSAANDEATVGAFRVQNPADAGGAPPPGLSGNVLRESQSRINQPLSVGFDQTLLSGSVAFASSTSEGTFTVQELLNGQVVGTATASGGSGVLSFDGAAFDALTLSDTAPSFEIDNLAVSTAPSAPSTAPATAPLGRGKPR